MSFKYKKWSKHTKIAVYTGVISLGIGVVVGMNVQKINSNSRLEPIKVDMPKQQKGKNGTQIINLIKNMATKDNYGPQEVLQRLNYYKPVLKKHQAKLAAEYVYKSTQNWSLLQNDFGEMLAGYVSYDKEAYQIHGSVLKNTNKINNNTIIGYIKDNGNQLLLTEDVGKNALGVMPDYQKLYKYLHGYQNTELNDYLKLGIDIQKSERQEIERNGRVTDIKNAADNFDELMVYLTTHPHSEYKKDIKSLLNREFQIIFGTSQLDGLSGRKLSTRDYAYLKSYEKKGDTLIRVNIKAYLEGISKSNRYSTEKNQKYIQSKANALFGNSVFRNDQSTNVLATQKNMEAAK